MAEEEGHTARASDTDIETDTSRQTHT